MMLIPSQGSVGVRFCFRFNIAGAARYLLLSHGAERNREGLQPAQRMGLCGMQRTGHVPS